MRLIGSLTSAISPEKVFGFSAYLKSKGIDNTIDETPSGFDVWIVDEDHLVEGEEQLTTFKANPEHPKYDIAPINEEPLEPKAPSSPSPRRRSPFSSAPYGKLSVAIILSAIVLFVWGQFQRGITLPPKIPGVVEAPVVGKLDKALLYDYSTYFTLRDKLLTLYTPKEIEEGEPPSPEAQAVLAQLKTTPFWTGLYQRVVAHIKNKNIKLGYDGPLFEKISSGEIYRLLTPALLHFNLLHIFFNLLWFVMLGNQVESRLGFWRFLAFMVLAALFSNTGQYLMSGSFFMGLSGVVCALAGFIWARQQVAPWEGYLLNKVTLIFLGVFVLGVFALQVVLFFFQISGITNIVIPIANTAHLTGGITGYLLGRLPAFSASLTNKKF